MRAHANNAILIRDKNPIYLQIDDCYKEYSEYLQTIINQMASVKHANEAVELINKIDQYISNHESQQLERLKELAIQSTNVYGFDKTIEKYSENIELFQTFFSTKHQLNALIEQINDAEKAKLAAEEQLRRERLAMEEAQKRMELEQKEALLRQSHTETQHTVNVHHTFVETQHQQHVHQQLEQRNAPEESQPLFIRMLYDVTAQEGERYALECQVHSNQRLQIEWFKNGAKIVNNHPNYSVHNVEGLCTFLINRASLDDSATYTCRATNSLGSVETAARLSVKPSEQVDILTPPRFIKPLKNVQANAGSSLMLDCFVEGNPLPTVQWFKNDVCIDVSPRFNISYINGEAYARIDELNAGDNGIFTCVAKNMLGVDQCSAKLIVNDVQSKGLHTTNGLFMFI